MTLTRKDAAATALTVLAVVVFAATYEGWNGVLVGDSHRWAAGAIKIRELTDVGPAAPS